MSTETGSLASPVSDGLSGVTGNSDVGYVEKDPTGRYVRYPEILGKGAFKTVYRAFDEVDGIEVAWNQVRIDVLRTSKDLEKLNSEVHILGSLKHENIIKLYDFWMDDSNKSFNMITELFTSGSLRQYRERHKNVDMKAIRNWAKQILNGLVYLHGQNPPIIHRDLKCDNIFVNGNHGQVKIGDLGLATVMEQSSACSIIGTPEFMAPELYEEEYNELVDVYSFGLCILEMVTCEYPYSECKNAAQIYKKVTSGIKPASINMVNDPQTKEFIEKCLLPSSERLPAKELLKEPFLHQGDENEGVICDPLLVPYQGPDVKLHMSGPLSMDLDSDYKQASWTEINGCSPRVLALEYQMINNNNEFRLRGEKLNDEIIMLTLRIACLNADVRDIIDFRFYPGSDTAQSVVTEMVKELKLTDHDVSDIAELIDYLIMKLLPNWKPSSDYSLTEPRTPHGVCPFLEDHSTSNENPRENDSLYDKSVSNISSSPSFADMQQDQISNGIFSNVVSLTSSSSSLSMADKDPDVEFKLKIDVIESHYKNLLEELSRRKEEALEAIKKEWMEKNATDER